MKIFKRTCKQCGEEYTVTSKNKNTNKICCSWNCYCIYRKGKPRIGYRYSRGYKYLFMPNHPDSSKQGYLAEHRYVAEKKIGRRIKTDEIVHHINGIKDDNRPENLQVCTRQEHNLIDEAIIAGKLKRDRESRRPVVQKNLEGSVVKIWESRTKAANHFGCSSATISAGVHKGRKAQGFLWCDID